MNLIKHKFETGERCDSDCWNCGLSCGVMGCRAETHMSSILLSIIHGEVDLHRKHRKARAGGARTNSSPERNRTPSPCTALKSNRGTGAAVKYTGELKSSELSEYDQLESHRCHRTRCYLSPWDTNTGSVPAYRAQLVHRCPTPPTRTDE